MDDNQQMVVRRKVLLDYADECRFIAQWQETEDSEQWWLEEALSAEAAAAQLDARA
jgi:hypothetical protein